MKNASDDISGDNNDSNDANITINANNAMFQYHAHNIVNAVNNDVDDTENDTNNANSVSNEDDQEYLGYNASVQLADVGNSVICLLMCLDTLAAQQGHLPTATNLYHVQ